MCVKFPLGNVTNVKREERAPPVPPPRDLHRKVATPISMYYENSALTNERKEGHAKAIHGVPNNDFERVMRRSQDRSLGHGVNGLRRPISNSEDHIAMMNNEYMQNFQHKSEQPRRPASVSADPHHYLLYANTPPWRKNTDKPNIIKPEPVQAKADYLYYADHSPRSRRPISITTSQNGHETQYLSDSQTSLNLRESVYKRPRNASEFWKKMDENERQRKQQNMFADSRSKSEYSSNNHLHRNSLYNEPTSLDGSDIRNKNLSNTLSRDTTDGSKMWKATTEYKRSITVEPPSVNSPTSKTHLRHKSDTFLPNSYQIPSDDEKTSERRKSTNLDDALNELEAIYNSLGLGDEDLLDRAEQRELMTPKFNEHFNDWNGNGEELQLRSQPTTPLRRVPRRSTLPDKLHDDMAFRRMNSKEKPVPGSRDSQSQISYMLASPVYVPYTSDDDRHSDRNEPDIVHDDMMYRNIKQMNNRLKTVDPQPPFGIPVVPVTPAPQSDYLHATPESRGRSRFIPRRSPDIVSDDLAYRSLRKDSRHSAHINGEEFNGHANNNHNYGEFIHTKESPSNIKKKRAVRSLSANIFTMIQKEIDDALNMSKVETIQKTHSNSDVTRRLRDVFENNDNEQEHYPRNKAVNSPPVAHRDITGPSTYRPYNDDYTTIPAAPTQRVERPPEDQERKKDKKWSFGKLFRRKKKEDESESSESDEGISTRSRKSKKKKRGSTTVSNFDHIVIRDTRRAQSVIKPNHRDYTDDGVLSDPSAGFTNYRKLPQHLYAESKESLSLSAKDEMSRSAKTSLETPTRKTRKGRLKARVEALRNSMRGDSSSDEGSLKSSNSSSMIRFRSEDSLMRSRDSSLNKRSRNARNERYIKRLSRDEENQLNKEAELLQQGYTKAEVEMLTRTPTSQSSGYGTCKRDQPKIKPDQILLDPNRRPMKSESISSFPSTTQSYPSSINFNAKVNNEHINYSIQYPSSNPNEDVMCVKFPLGNVTNVKREERAPPVPPPRDLHRKVATPISMYYENSALTNERKEGHAKAIHGVPNNDFERVMRRSQDRSLGHGVNGLRRPISNSEDHIAMMNNEYMQNFQHKSEQPRRPASVSADPHHYLLYANTPPWRKNTDKPNIIKPEPVQAKADYLYYADHSPRSRRPISITTSQNGHETQYLSDSQTSLNLRESVYKRPRNASEFWKKMDENERQRKQQNMFADSRSKSEYSSNNHLHRNSLYNEPTSLDGSDIRNKNLSNTLSRDTTDGSKMWKATTEYKRSITVEPPSVNSPTSKTHLRHKSDTFLPNSYQIPSDDEKTSERRKSTNLDDALNELEAIYNSLGLGDEDLLDRAEQRELMTPKFNEHFNDWNGNGEELQLRSQPTTPLRRVPRRSTLPDKLHDDMAFRRMNSKEKPVPGSRDSQSQISYMLASPVYVPYTSDDDRHSDRNEPDIVHDDMMYRNIKQMNNRLKTVDPQPPFGIPVVPVTPAPQSDYLHATPESRGRSRFIPRRSPDIVSDDLAYRSLRKDSRHSAHINGEEFNGHANNNHNYGEFIHTKESPSNIKKKRAVRSLSANIFTMIQKEIDDALNMSKVATIQKTHSNSDVTRRLRDVFENNDNEQEHYPRNKVKQRHNTVNLFVNNIHAPSHHFAKDDSYIHNDDKYLAKPPYCDKSKSSSPSNRSPQSTKRSSRGEFQHVLTMLAQEAMDTSNKLGVALAELDKNRNNTDRKSDIQNKLSDSRLNFLNGLTNKSCLDTNNAPPEIKFVKVHSEIVNESKKDPEVIRTDTESKAKKTEDSLMAISNQLHKVEDQLKHSFEKEINFDDESTRLSNYIAKTEQKLKAQEVVVPESKLVPDVVPLSLQNDSIKIESLDSIERADKQSVESAPKPTEVNESNEISAFRELKDGISDLIAGISQVNEKFCLPKSQKDRSECQSPSQMASITEVSAKLNQVQEPPKAVPQHRGSVNLSIYEDDLEVKKETTDSTEYNSSEELAAIFQTENKALPVTEIVKETGRTELNSPKLVQNVNQQLRRLSVDTTDTPSLNPLPTNIVPWRTKRQNPFDNRGTKGWETNSSTLMLACAYTLMFTQHLADLDWLTLLGLLLAIVTIIAMLLI